jgi:hypothetical protein
MIAHPRLAIALLLSALTVVPASAEDASSSRYTKAGSAQPQCQQARAPVEGFSCMGPGGWRLNLGFPAFGATLNFAQEGRNPSVHAPADGRRVDIEDMVGKAATVEWRGTVSGGSFQPYAAIVRVLVLDAAQRRAMIEQGAPVQAPRRAQVLVVTRLGPEGACVVAYVDAQANPKPNEMARAAADTLARSATCPVARVEVLGVKTPVLASHLQ